MANTACAVICEYNPLHGGHAYQLAKMRERFGTVVCILGGNLTQRGEVAVSDRFVRARAALANGANLVVELPAPWCCASAREFARGGVALARMMGVDALVCSAESDGDALREAAKRDIAQEIRTLIRQEGFSYPVAAERVLGRALAGCPNDILTLEYLRAAESFPVHILKRERSFASSSAIRASENPLQALPDRSAAVFAKDASFPRQTARAGEFLLACWRNSPVRDCYGMTDELFSRLTDAAARADSWEGFLQKGVNKMFTAARVRRASWSAAFGFPRELPAMLPPYTLLLAADGIGRSFLKRTAKTRTVPLLTRPTNATLRGEAAAVFALNTRINEVLRLFFGGQPDRALHPFIQPERS